VTDRKRRVVQMICTAAQERTPTGSLVGDGDLGGPSDVLADSGQREVQDVQDNVR
jgi:hypothetical protein